MLDAPFAVLPDSLKFGSNVLKSIQLTASYRGETGEQWVAKAKQWFLTDYVTCVLDAPLAVLPDSLKSGSNILRNIQLIASYHGKTGEQWVDEAKQWFLRVYVTM